MKNRRPIHLLDKTFSEWTEQIGSLCLRIVASSIHRRIFSIQLHSILLRNVLILLMFEDTCWGLTAFWCALLRILPEDVIFDFGVCNLLLQQLKKVPVKKHSAVLLTIAYEILLKVLQLLIYFRYCAVRCNSYYLMNWLYYGNRKKRFVDRKIIYLLEDLTLRNH